LMNVEPNILFIVHEGAPFCRCWSEQSQPTPKGAPSYNAFTSTTNPDFSPWTRSMPNCQCLLTWILTLKVGFEAVWGIWTWASPSAAAWLGLASPPESAASQSGQAGQRALAAYPAGCGRHEEWRGQGSCHDQHCTRVANPMRSG